MHVVVFDWICSLSKQWRDAVDGRKSICVVPNDNLEVCLLPLDATELLIPVTALTLSAVDCAHCILAF
jgi:hypothetical protein